MEFIENLTTKLGISIRSLGHFLCIHHSPLARFDSAERMLPRTALPEVLELYNRPKRPYLLQTRYRTSSNKKNCNCKLTGALPNAAIWKKS